MTDQLEACRLCGLRTETLSKRHGANTCRSCLTSFWFAEVLLEADVSEEEIVPTLAFARYAETLWNIRDSEQRAAAARQLVAQYPAFELVEVVDGVPVLRMKHAIAEVVRYQGSDLAKGICIRVLSRSAKPDAIAKLYRDACEREKLMVHRTSPGSLSWEFDQMHLVVNVGPREEIHSTRLDHFAEYPQVRRFSFPMPAVVEALLRALLGYGQKKNQIFAALLSDLGRHTRMSPETTVVASVLWDLRGKRSPEAKVPRSEETAGLVNQSLLIPLEKEPITVSSNDAVWRDAKKVSHRFDLCKYLLQETRNRDNPFKKRLSTAP